MAVLVEAFSVIVKISSIRDNYRGGWEAFKKDCPNGTLVSDGEVARIGFTEPRHVVVMIDRLKMVGFKFAGESKESDFCVVDQLTGPTTVCDWIDVGTVPMDGDDTHLVTAGRLKGSQLQALMKPVGWKFKGSLSEKPNFMNVADVFQRIKFLRMEGDKGVFWDPVDKAEVFIPKARDKNH
jgi:hypothetical protein